MSIIILWQDHLTCTMSKCAEVFSSPWKKIKYPNSNHARVIGLFASTFDTYSILIVAFYSIYVHNYNETTYNRVHTWSFKLESVVVFEERKLQIHTSLRIRERETNHSYQLLNQLMQHSIHDFILAKKLINPVQVFKFL